MSSVEREQLVRDIVDVIVTSVNLRHVDKSQIQEETSLAVNGLNLDSLDMLEVVVGVEQKFNVKIVDAEEGKRVLRTIGTIADFVQKRDA